jgi:hypothetical protein
VSDVPVRIARDECIEAGTERATEPGARPSPIAGAGSTPFDRDKSRDGVTAPRAIRPSYLPLESAPHGCNNRPYQSLDWEPRDRLPAPSLRARE